MESEILELEASFADAGYAPWEDRLDINPRMFQKYAEPRQFWDWRQFGVHLLGAVRDKSLLDLGCGMGEEAVYFAKLGARVSAIDISEVGIRITRKRAEFNNVADRVSAEVMQATPTNFASESFDIVHGIGILHHVGLGDGLAETKRLLKPGGAGLFLEPMGNSRLVEGAKEFIQSRWGKKLKLRDVNEHEETLKFHELMKFKDTFAYYRLYPYHLLTRIRKLLFPRRVHDALRRIDYRLLKMAPFLRHYAGAVVIHLRK
jgi:SAM-dependent methyltransferase